MNEYNVIGLMSGTSLDGLDIAFCHFQFDNKWSFEIAEAQTFEYHKILREQLSNAHLFSAADLMRLDAEVAITFSNHVKDFIKRHNLKPGFISSHGHTIFHQPAQRFTTQIGNGGIIAALTGYDVVCDFRTTDVALGGQGAPLVPAGDKFLFGEYDYCLNLGGIANISFDSSGERIASDICYANMGLNYLAHNEGLDFDNEGTLAAKGIVDEPLLTQLNQLDFHIRQFPKSTGKEYFEEKIKPLLDSSVQPGYNKLRTFCEYISIQIANNFSKNQVREKTLLATGGGAYNSFLIDLLKKNLPVEIIIPPKKIIEFKEALIFAFLGVLRMRNEVNVFRSVTGAKCSSCSGAIYKAAAEN